MTIRSRWTAIQEAEAVKFNRTQLRQGASLTQDTADEEPPYQYKAERCPGTPHRLCGRMMHPMDLWDVSGLPTDVTGGAHYLCTACRFLLEARGYIRKGDIEASQQNDLKD